MAKKSSAKKKNSKSSITKSATASIAKAAGNVRDKIPSKLPVDEIRKQLLTYASEIEKYLGSAGAEVENFKFSVEKGDTGLIIDAAFKATIST